MRPDPNATEALPQRRVELIASFKQLLAVNVAAAVAGAALLALALGIRPGVTMAWFPVLFALCLLYLITDTLYWLQRGIHRVVLDDGVLHVYRGRELRHEAIPVEAITDVHLHQRLTRRSLQILLGSSVLRLPGLTLYPGRKLWLVSDAFELREFDRLVAALLPHARQLKAEGEVPTTRS